MKYIDRLHEISQKTERLIIGLMSGTSLDGLDIALCRINGNGLGTSVQLIEFETIEFDQSFRNEVQSIFSKKQVDLEKLCILNEVIATVHAEMVLGSLKKWKVDRENIDCIASHGQTIYHAPQRLHKIPSYPNATLQIGDGDHLAVRTGIITLCDFRQKNIAAGGEGAPLALYADSLLFSSAQEDRILLNIGGIANFTYIPRSGDPSQIISSDIGPGNTLINAAAAEKFNLPFDQDGKIAAGGKVHEGLLNAMLEHTFFKEALPKTIGPELFNLQFVEDAKQRNGITEIAGNDLISTLTALTSQAIANAVKEFKAPLTIYGSGGGFHNPSIVNGLKPLLPGIQIRSTADLGIDPDAKEAILFAILANETLSGSVLQVKNWPAVSMGKICLPD